MQQIHSKRLLQGIVNSQLRLCLTAQSFQKKLKKTMIAKLEGHASMAYPTSLSRSGIKFHKALIMQ